MVDDGHGLTIDELVGNVATKEDRMSVALVRVSDPTSEPWLTLDYDECAPPPTSLWVSDGTT